MRERININENWSFFKEDVGLQAAQTGGGAAVDIPYTWNGTDGQDGGNDYMRGTCWFVKNFQQPAFCDGQQVYLEFKGVNSSAVVYLNGEKIAAHDGGYSTFRACITAYLKKDNVLAVAVDNSVNDTVYPQTADFTFYGGIYRDVNLIVVSDNRFSLDHFGSCGVFVTPSLQGGDGKVDVKTVITGSGEVTLEVLDGEGNSVAVGKGGETLTVKDAHLWQGISDPYLYTLRAQLIENGKPSDAVEVRFGFRTFAFDANKGFFLNGKSYPLRGVCRHQDRPKIGNAITKHMHDEDMQLIKEIGANTVRLAHYQHDDYFYDLCDSSGMVVWAEIPYISKHLKNADDNAVSQMKELILQQYNHPSIAVWGVSNEITMHRAGKERLALHRVLNDLCHELDATRPTVTANYVMCGSGNPIPHSTDVTSFNLYYGWYVPFCFITGMVLDHYHKRYPNSPVGLSEYGAESMPNLHSAHPRRGDNTEEYQLIYHEKLIKIINKRDYLWGTHVWNMFDFAADARNQGGEAGMNHKGLVTFDRQTRKDSFYLYKAYWSKTPFIHICGKRFKNRTGSSAKIKVYTNQEQVELFVNGQCFEVKKADKVFEFKIPFAADTSVTAKSGELQDSCSLIKVRKKDKSYKMRGKTKNQSWEK